MTIPVYISGKRNGNDSIVSDIGQIITAPYAYDEVANIETLIINTAYNLFPVKPKMQFVVTGLMFTAKKGVATDVIVDVYEADSATSTASTMDIITLEMLKSTDRDLLGLNYLVAAGSYINAKADDTDTLVTMMGYYIPAKG